MMELGADKSLALSSKPNSEIATWSDTVDEKGITDHIQRGTKEQRPTEFNAESSVCNSS